MYLSKFVTSKMSSANLHFQKVSKTASGCQTIVNHLSSFEDKLFIRLVSRLFCILCHVPLFIYR